MKVNATQFKAKCLAMIDEVHAGGEPVTITKRGRVVAKLVNANPVDEKPWLALRGKAKLIGDPFAPVVSEDEIEALK